MNTNEDIIKTLGKDLKSVPGVDSIRIFGSRARGDYSEDSDLDILVITKTDEQETLQTVRDVIWKISLQSGIFISPLILTKEQVEKTPLRSSSIIKNIQKEVLPV